MIEVEETQSGLYVTDAAKNELHIEMPDWQEGGEVDSFYRRVDKKIAGRASKITVPESAITVLTDGRDKWRTFLSEEGPLFFEEGSHQLQVSSNIYVYIYIKSKFKIIRQHSEEKITIKFPNQLPITVAFRGNIGKPIDTISVSKNIEDLCTAIPYLSTAIESQKPDSSYPSLREHPPLLKLEEKTVIPRKLKDVANFSGIEFKLPNDLKSIFLATPLVYYLNAQMSIHSQRNIFINIPDTDTQLRLPEGPKLEDEIVSLLRRVFWLDCIVRNSGPFFIPIKENKLLNDLDVDAEHLYDLDLKDRFTEYLEIEFDKISNKFPKWHLATYINPNFQNVSTLPHLMDRLSLIYLPETYELDPNELLDTALNNNYRDSKGLEHGESVPQVDPKLPKFKHGRFHGWLAEEFPIGVFKATVNAFENRLNLVQTINPKKTVTVVINDQKMVEEKSSVENIYQQRSDELTIEVKILENVDSKILADVFERENDFVHFIGHCNENGLVCQNGELSISSIDSSKCKTFFLNACGSFKEGLELIKKGSIGGVVTRNKILDKDATRIGTEFARLIMNGFNLEHASKIAKEKSITSYEYSVIGDGAFRLSQGNDPDPVSLTVSSLNDGRFSVETQVTSIRDIGRCYQSRLAEDNKLSLNGNPEVNEISKQKLVDFLIEYDLPVIFDDTYYWSDELSVKLRN